MRKISMFVLAAVVALVAACGGGADSADAGVDAAEGTGAVAAPAVVDGTGDGTGDSVQALETPADGSVAVEPAPVADVPAAVPTTEPAPAAE